MRNFFREVTIITQNELKEEMMSTWSRLTPFDASLHWASYGGSGTSADVSMTWGPRFKLTSTIEGFATAGVEGGVYGLVGDAFTSSEEANTLEKEGKIRSLDPRTGGQVAAGIIRDKCVFKAIGLLHRNFGTDQNEPSARLSVGYLTDMGIRLSIYAEYNFAQQASSIGAPFMIFPAGGEIAYMF